MNENRTHGHLITIYVRYWQVSNGKYLRFHLKCRKRGVLRDPQKVEVRDEIGFGAVTFSNEFLDVAAHPSHLSNSLSL